jgi:hypothetical protein
MCRIGLGAAEQMPWYGATWTYYKDCLSTGLDNQMYKAYTLKCETANSWDVSNFKVVVIYLKYVQILIDSAN